MTENKDLQRLLKEHLTISSITKNLPNTTEITALDAVQSAVKEWLREKQRKITFSKAGEGAPYYAYLVFQELIEEL